MPKELKPLITEIRLILVVYLFNVSFLVYSSLHCINSLSFCLFSNIGVCFDGLKLSANDVIDSQKCSNREGMLQIISLNDQFA